MLRLDASLLAQHALIALAFRDEPFGLLLDARAVICSVVSASVMPLRARPAIDTPSFAATRFFGCGPHLAKVLQPLRWIGLQIGELGAGD